MYTEAVPAVPKSDLTTAIVDPWARVMASLSGGGLSAVVVYRVMSVQWVAGIKKT